MDRNTALARIERARSLCSEACYMVALQRRRLQATEPEDGRFIMRRWGDWQFLIVALRRLRQAARIAAFSPTVTAAIATFDRSLLGLHTMRNVGEHVEDYAQDRGRDATGDRKQLQVGTFGADELAWLGHRLDADAAMAAAEELFAAVRLAQASEDS